MTREFTPAVVVQALELQAPEAAPRGAEMLERVLAPLAPLEEPHSALQAAAPLALSRAHAESAG